MHRIPISLLMFVAVCGLAHLVFADQTVPDGQWYGKFEDACFVAPNQLVVVTDKAAYVSTDNPRTLSGIAMFDKSISPFAIVGGNEKAWYYLAGDAVDWNFQGFILEKFSDGHLKEIKRNPRSTFYQFQSDLIGAFTENTTLNVTTDGGDTWRVYDNILSKGENTAGMRWIAKDKFIVGGDRGSVAACSLGNDGTLTKNWSVVIDKMYRVGSIYPVDDKLCWVSGDGPIVELQLKDGAIVAAYNKNRVSAGTLGVHDDQVLTAGGERVVRWTVKGTELQFDGFLATKAIALFYDEKQNPVFIDKSGKFIQFDNEGKAKQLPAKIDNHSFVIISDPNNMAVDDPLTTELFNLASEVGGTTALAISDQAITNKELKTQRDKFVWEINEMKRILAQRAATSPASAPASQPAGQHSP